jgi:hypothetical protein
MLKVTITQLDLWHKLHPIHRHYTIQVSQLHYPRLSGQHGKLHNDTLVSIKPSIHSAVMGQLCTIYTHFMKFNPMKKKSMVANTLIYFIHKDSNSCSIAL